jgi:hypothetical protein
MVEKCETCRFSHEARSDIKLSCRRYPPQLVGDKNHGRADRAEFPAVYPSAWCGEHQPKDSPHD